MTMEFNIADLIERVAKYVVISYKQGDYDSTQMGSRRPNDDCPTHRTPINNLYLGGASSSPGGLVTFGAGYSTANAPAEDLGLEKWWTEPDHVTAARVNGYATIETNIPQSEEVHHGSSKI